MNKRQTSGPANERALAEKLRQLLVTVTWLKGGEVEFVSRDADPGFDLLATIFLPGGGRGVLCVVCKQELRASMFRSIAGRKLSPPGRPRVTVPVLALPFVSLRIAELCAEYGWSWFDLAGNYRLDIPGVLQLRHSGNEPVHHRPRPGANLGTREAARVIRVLLAPENAGKRWRQRDIQTHTQPNVSIGLVNKVMGHLRDEAFLEKIEDGGVRLRDPLKLLSVWRDAYRFDRHEQRAYFTLLKGKQLREALASLDSQTGGFAAYAAFSAADFQAPHVRQPRTWLYVGDRFLSEFERAVEAKPVESGENIILLVPDDDGVFYLGDEGGNGPGRLKCTNAIQTYVDLAHCGGRGEEAAEALLSQAIKPAWKLQGLL